MLRLLSDLRAILVCTALVAVLILAVCVIRADTESTEDSGETHDTVVSEETDTSDSVSAATPEVPSEAEEGDAVIGQTLAASCSACHGADGNTTTPEYSNLAGQGEKYLFLQMKQIQTGDREIPLMAGQLTQMDDSDLRHIAAYYASLPGRIGQSKEEMLEEGGAIYRGGILEKKVAACSACHAPNGGGNMLAGFPRVSGQTVEYTIAQLKAYRAGERTTDEEYNGMMRDIAENLSDSEIEAVANYMTGLYWGRSSSP